MARFAGELGSEAAAAIREFKWLDQRATLSLNREEMQVSKWEWREA